MCVCVRMCLLGVIFETVPWMWVEARQVKNPEHTIRLTPPVSLAACPSPGPRACNVNPRLDRHWTIITQTQTHIHTISACRCVPPPPFHILDQPHLLVSLSLSS